MPTLLIILLLCFIYWAGRRITKEVLIRNRGLSYAARGNREWGCAQAQKNYERAKALWPLFWFVVLTGRALGGVICKTRILLSRRELRR